MQVRIPIQYFIYNVIYLIFHATLLTVCIFKGLSFEIISGRVSQWRKYRCDKSRSVAAPDRCFYLNQAYISMFIAGLKKGKTNRSQTATDVAMVIKESLGSWSHMWSLSNVSGCGSTSLFGSRVGTHQGK